MRQRHHLPSIKEEAAQRVKKMPTEQELTRENVAAMSKKPKKCHCNYAIGKPLASLLNTLGSTGRYLGR